MYSRSKSFHYISLGWQILLFIQLCHNHHNESQKTRCKLLKAGYMSSGHSRIHLAEPSRHFHFNFTRLQSIAVRKLASKRAYILISSCQHIKESSSSHEIKPATWMRIIKAAEKMCFLISRMDYNSHKIHSERCPDDLFCQNAKKVLVTKYYHLVSSNIPVSSWEVSVCFF